MLLVVLTWLVLFGLLIFIGTGVYAIFITICSYNCESKPDLIHFAWLGYASLIAFLQIYSVFQPINIFTVFIVSALVLASYFFSHQYLSPSFERFAKMEFRSKVIMAIGSILIISYLAFVSSYPVEDYDTRLYHLNAVKWASTYPAIPGIANLHGRLAFNSSFHLFAAMTNASFLDGRAVHIANGFLLLLLSLQWLVCIIRIKKNDLQLNEIFVCITAPYLLMFTSKWVSPTLGTDRPFHILTFATIYYLLSIKSAAPSQWLDAVDNKTQFSWFLILTLATTAFTTKLLGIPLLAILLPLYLVLLIYKNKNGELGFLSPRLLSVMYGFPIILILGLVLRYVILSGWLLYPFPIGNLHLDWSLSPEQVTNQLNWTKSWARMPKVHPEIVLGNGMSFWFPRWFDIFRHTYQMILLFSGMCGLLYIAFGAFGLAKNYAWLKGLPFFAAMLVGITGLIFWFFSAPDIRFGEGYLWVFTSVSVASVFKRCFNNFARTFVISVLVIESAYMLRVGRILRPPLQITSSSWLIMPQEEVNATGSLELITVNNGQTPPLIIYKPIFDDRCGNSPLPCSPYIAVSSTIAWRVPGDLRYGFKTIGDRGADMHK